MARDYYEVLGVGRDASEPELKKAFRELAKQYHPDRNPGDPTAESKFKEASEAYEVLSNAEKRQIYDRHGHDGLKGRGFEPNFTDVGDIFSQFSEIFGFGDLFGGRRGSRGGPRRGADVELSIRLDFMEAVTGVAKEIQVPRHVPCDPCTGSGLKAGASRTQCNTCAGAGQVYQQMGFMRIRSVCPACQGEGKVSNPADRCPSCRGTGRQRVVEGLSVKVPAGVESGMRLHIGGKGEAGDPGAPAGNLFVVLDVAPHEVFKREGADTFVQIPVHYARMCLGGEITIPTVHGEEALTIPAGCESGKVFTLRGKGVDRVQSRSGRGDHHVQLVVDVPRKVTPEEERLLRELAALQGQNVDDKGFWKGLFAKFTS